MLLDFVVRFGFNSWQVTARRMCNKNIIAVLYAEIGMNTELLIQEMESYGWEFANISDRKQLYGVQFRVMTFDPSYPTELTNYVFGCKYLYHWTQEERIQSVLSTGIEPRSENKLLMYKPKVHLIKEDITKKGASELGWQLYNINTRVGGKYFLVRVDVEKILKNSKFYGDTRCEAGVTTRFIIPKESLGLFGKIEYTNRDVYCEEMIDIIADNNTMKD